MFLNKTATLVKVLDERQSLYKLSCPVKYGWNNSSWAEYGEIAEDENESAKTTEYVVASKARGWTGAPGEGSFVGGLLGQNTCECLVFPATESGSMLEMIDIGGSYTCPGGHEEALEGMGFSVISPGPDSVKEASKSPKFRV